MGGHAGDRPVYELAELLLSIWRMQARTHSPYRLDALRDRAAKCTRAILAKLGVDEALCIRGKVLIPYEVGGVTELRPLRLRDLDVERDEHGVVMLREALERLYKCQFLDDREHRRVVESLYLMTDCSAEEAEEIIRDLAKGDFPASPAEFGEMARAYLELDRLNGRPTVADQLLVPFACSLDQLAEDQL